MTKIETRSSKLEDTTCRKARPVRDFSDLQVWQLARELRNVSYNFLRRFPLDERHALSSQIRRASTSITANIAEGFGRYSYQENIQICRLARGSAFELRDHFITALDQSYISVDEQRTADLLAQRVIQTLNGYIRATQARQSEGARRHP